MAHDTYEIGVGQSQGARTLMQDAYMLHPSGQAFGVFDGHGSRGESAAELMVATTKAMKLNGDYGVDGKVIDRVFRRSNELLEAPTYYHAGTTATLATIRQNQGNRDVTCYWVGDTRAYLIDPLREGSVLRLTNPHTVDNFEEVKRMRKLGLEVSGEYFRSNAGSLAVSRAIGDNHFRGVIWNPDVKQARSSRRHRILLLASDGVANNKTEEEVFDDIRELRKAQQSMGKIAEYLAYKYGKMTGDNATALLVDLPQLSDRD